MGTTGSSNVVGPAQRSQWKSLPSCPAVSNPPDYDLTLTWYGVQTDGPLTSGVVTSDMYITNANQILNYMYKSPLNYTGICLHLDPPSAGTPASGKPDNFSSNVDAIVELIASIPTKYRVGFHAVVESDATWQISYGPKPDNILPTVCNALDNCVAQPGPGPSKPCTNPPPPTSFDPKYATTDFGYGKGMGPFTVDGTPTGKPLYDNVLIWAPIDGNNKFAPGVVCDKCFYVKYWNDPAKGIPQYGQCPCAETGCKTPAPASAPASLAPGVKPWTPPGAVPATLAPGVKPWTPPGAVPATLAPGVKPWTPPGAVPATLAPGVKPWTPPGAVPATLAPGVKPWTPSPGPGPSTMCTAPPVTIPKGSTWPSNVVAGGPIYNPTPEQCNKCWYVKYWKDSPTNTVPQYGACPCNPSSCGPEDAVMAGAGIGCTAPPEYLPQNTTPWPIQVVPGVSQTPAPPPGCSDSDKCWYIIGYYDAYQTKPIYAACPDSQAQTTLGFNMKLNCPPKYDGKSPLGQAATDISACFYNASAVPTIQSTLAPGFTASSFVTNQFGGTGGITASSPWQVFSSNPAFNGEGVCPYKIEPVGAPGTSPYMAPGAALPPAASWPPGCPGNMSRLAWYVAFVNAKLRARGSKQRISTMNWDAEGNGPDGLQCSIYQFLYALRQYGTADDVLPTVYNRKTKTMQPAKWVLYQNGSTNLNASAAYASGQPCSGWQNTSINGPQFRDPAPAGVSTFNDMAVFQAAPEYYWTVAGNAPYMSDLGNVPAQTPYNGLLKDLGSAGYLGCPQSAPGKPGYDAQCGCRRTVYATYGKLDNGGSNLLEVLSTVYDMHRADIPTSTPAFSIEHLGSPDDSTDFALCVNSQNFCSNLNGPACANNAKCVVRCGVMNAFGSWTEQCFKQFLDAFAVKYNATSLMVYDAGFLPQTWIGTTPSLAPSLNCTDRSVGTPCFAPGAATNPTGSAACACPPITPAAPPGPW
jgi:hypothetical protein